MKTTRREFVKTIGAGAIGAGLARGLLKAQAPAVSSGRPYDVVVVGAGVFGSWVAYRLQEAGRRVALIDAYGPGNARASSGGQTRVIRMGYGDQEIYTRWSMRSLELWKGLVGPVGRPSLFQEAGVLWMARGEDPLTTKTLATLQRLNIVHERLGRAELDRRWPQIDFGPNTWAIHEPDSGFLVAFHAVQAVVQMAEASGVEYLQEAVVPPEGKGRLGAITTRSGKTIAAEKFVFACGPWLPKVFPDLLGDRIFPTRQEVFYFGIPPGDSRFRSPAMPAWVDFAEEIYGIPDFKGRGFKVAPDRHGPAFDPDTGSRVITAETLATVRDFVGRRFPALKDAPLVGSEVCQYENTSNGDFLIDQHPERGNVWLVGGGSGHGFKHGPALGEYVAARILEGGAVEPRFSLATKQKVQKRSVY
ncbi:MAG TPA: FAD-dependent oxidoreductase [Thermoanaerobaculia bacterium]|nr:FAD-dependent oxidoreductase [Thermoanaerobaculia bacterium]